MHGFRSTSQGLNGRLEWKSDPDDDTAHRTLLRWLNSALTGRFLTPSESVSNTIRGNLGEFIAYRLGKEFVFTNVEIADAANAWDPLSKISRPDIDIVWLYFGCTEGDDWAALQEVKTTGNASLALADGVDIRLWEAIWPESSLDAANAPWCPEEQTRIQGPRTPRAKSHSSWRASPERSDGDPACSDSHS